MDNGEIASVLCGRRSIEHECSVLIVDKDAVH